MLVLPPGWKAFSSGKDIYGYLMSVEGKVYRDKDGRKTVQFSHRGRSYFAKIYHGLGWKRFFKYLLQFRIPVLSARNEWRAIQRLQSLAIDTLGLVGYGQRGRNPIRRQSFIITEALENTLSLENVCDAWDGRSPDPALKRHLIVKVARFARRLHDSGMCHRDFYICHFLVDRAGLDPGADLNGLKIHLIDLHRVRFFPRLPARWRVKDIAGLYFSSMDAGLNRRDLLRFMRHYREGPLQRNLYQDRRLWRAVERRATALYRKIHRREPPPAGADGGGHPL